MYRVTSVATNLHQFVYSCDFMFANTESKSKQKMNPFYYFSFLMAITILLLFTVPSSYAQLNLNDSSVSWQLVMISSYPACSNYHYQMMNRYADITEKYLELYHVDAVKYYQECMTEKAYNSKYEAPTDVNLVILVYDRNLGEAELHSQDLGGFFTHVGDDRTKNNLIVFCDCSNFYYSNPTWILTHELSHFVLYYDGFDEQQIEQVHDIDKKYDHCQDVQYDESCKTLTTKLNTNAYSWSVMPPYNEALKKLSVTDTNIEIDPTIKASKSLLGSDLNTMITKWWKNGMISESEYILAMKSLYESDYVIQEKEKLEIENNSFVLFAEAPKLVDESYINEKISQLSKEELQDLLKRSPFVTKQQTQNPDDVKVFASAKVTASSSTSMN